MIVSYICCHEVSDHHTGMSFQRWKNKWKLSGNNRSTVSWNPKNNNLRPSVIQAENSFFLSLCCAWDDMTQTLSPGAIWAPAGDTEEAAPTTAEKPGKTGVFSFTKGEGHFRCVNVKHSLGLCFTGPKYLNSRGTFASRSGGFARIWNTYGEFTYSEAQWVFSVRGLPAIWSSRHYPYTHFTDGNAAATQANQCHQLRSTRFELTALLLALSVTSSFILLHYKYWTPPMSQALF